MNIKINKIISKTHINQIKRKIKKRKNYNFYDLYIYTYI